MDDKTPAAPGRGRQPQRAPAAGDVQAAATCRLRFLRRGRHTGYLADLGVSHVYLSPVLQAAKGSTHGYDVVDPSAVNEELGGEHGPLRVAKGAGRGRAGPDTRHRAQPHGRGLAGQPVVVGRPGERPVQRLRRLLRRGLGHAGGQRDGRPHPVLLLPFLGDHYGRELEAGPVQAGALGRDLHAALLRPAGSYRPPQPRPAGVAKRPGTCPGAPIRPSGRRSRASGPLWAGSRRRGPPTGPASGSGTGTRRSCGPGWPPCALSTRRWRPLWTPRPKP